MLTDITIVNPDGQRGVLPLGFDVLPIGKPGDSPIARGVHPRLLVTPESLLSLRERIRTDDAFRARWQTAVSQFESPSSVWAKPPADPTKVDPFNTAFAAFLAMVRRPDDDLGLTWVSSWSVYRDRIMAAASAWERIRRHEPKAIATALIYDCLHADLTADERAACAAWVELGFANNDYLAGGIEVYDNGASDDHAAKLLCALASEKAAARLEDAYTQTMWVADTNDWMGYGFGLGREWHDGFTSRQGVPFLLLALKNAGGYTDAQTFDRFTTHLRDAWQLVAQALIPHPAIGAAKNSAPWTNDKFHTQDPVKGFHRQRNVSAYMVWANALLSGRVNLDATGMSDQATLADSETDLLGYLRYVFDIPTPGTTRPDHRSVLDFTQIGTGAGTQTSGRGNTFWCFPAWLILNAQEQPAVTPEDAGIPLVRRWWPGTLDWTFIHSGFDVTDSSVIRYTHRRYAASQYERGTDQNGRWHVHRDGPLLVQRGETGHSPTTKMFTWCANGAVTFIDPTLYPLFTFNVADDGDNGGARNFVSKNTKDAILAEPTADFGSVTAWHADDRVVAITSDLTRSYNGREVQYGPVTWNEPKIARFVREFVVIRRGGDGTDREKVFTYDRIQLLDTKFEPRYNLSPATNPDIDGTEHEILPWGPDKDDPAFDWYAAGPTHWEYDGATRLIYDNRFEPTAALPGNGKVCVTWLEPTEATIRKSGGTNAVSKTIARHNGYPFFSPWRGWQGKDEWSKVNSPEHRAYVGLYTVSVSPATVSLDTRFLMACEVMAAGDTPSAATSVACDSGSVAVRCGASIVVFGKDGDRASGWVDVPIGVELVVVVNHATKSPLRFTAPFGRVAF